MDSEPLFFASPEELRDWFELHHETQDELWLGNYRKATGKQTITWSESVDQALCFGWIDGVRKTLNEEAYMQRFHAASAGKQLERSERREGGQAGGGPQRDEARDARPQAWNPYRRFRGGTETPPPLTADSEETLGLRTTRLVAYRAGRQWSLRCVTLQQR